MVARNAAIDLLGLYLNKTGNSYISMLGFLTN